jgi:hypothetical protein
MHVYVAHPDGEAKFRLQPDLALADHTGLSERKLLDAKGVVASHLEEIICAWHEHFGR